MKEFMLKHPIITLMIIQDICSTIENVMLGRHVRYTRGERVIASVEAGIEEVRKAKTKEPIGFKFVREEA